MYTRTRGAWKGPWQVKNCIEGRIGWIVRYYVQLVVYSRGSVRHLAKHGASQTKQGKRSELIKRR